MTLQLRHETLAETHHLCIALSSRREITAAFGSTHREGRQRILECLLEGKELHNTKVHARVEADTAFVRTDSGVHLHAETAVDLYFALIVHPWHTEHDHALRLYDSLHHFLLAQIRIGHNHRSHRLHYFFYGLVKLFLTGVFSDQLRHEAVHIGLRLFVHFCTFFVVKQKLRTKLQIILHICKIAYKNFRKISVPLHMSFFCSTFAPKLRNYAVERMNIERKNE